MVRAVIDDFKVALQFLTRLPVRVPEPWPEGALARSVAMFPLIGLLIGAVGALAFTIAIWLGLPPALAAVLAVAVQILLTGGLHEDGLADLADGFGGGRTREEKLEIMRDSTLGSFGVIALILALLARIGAIAALAQPATVAAVLLAAAAISRAMMPPVMLWLAPARRDGLAATSGRPQLARVLTGLGLATLIVVRAVGAAPRPLGYPARGGRRARAGDPRPAPDRRPYRRRARRRAAAGRDRMSVRGAHLPTGGIARRAQIEARRPPSGWCGGSPGSVGPTPDVPARLASAASAPVMPAALRAGPVPRILFR